jgi:hypothetical protein
MGHEAHKNVPRQPSQRQSGCHSCVTLGEKGWPSYRQHSLVTVRQWLSKELRDEAPKEVAASSSNQKLHRHYYKNCYPHTLIAAVFY